MSADVRSLTPAQLAGVGLAVEVDPLIATRFFHRLRTGSQFVTGPHHRVIGDALARVEGGEITRLIINVPPGYSKTAMVSVDLPARLLAKFPHALFITASYSQDRAFETSLTVRDTVRAKEFRALWPLQFRADVDAKRFWKTEQGGGLLAVSSGGQLTGFHAGRMAMSGFSGALIFDDPLKPDDALSNVKRARVNDRFINTFRSRVAHERVPIIIVMQRLCDDDLCGFLLRGGSPADRWHHLLLPAMIDNSAPYPVEYTHGIPIPHGLPDGPLWPYKHDRDTLSKMALGDAYTYQSQYQQAPIALGGRVFRSDWWRYYQAYDPRISVVYLTRVGEDNFSEKVALVEKRIYADTAMKKTESADYSVFQCWGLGDNGNIYLLDQLRGKFEAPQLRDLFLRFCDKHDFGGELQNSLGVAERVVEDKASGIGLVQEVKGLRGEYFVKGKPRDIDKRSRARSGTTAIADGRVWLPINASWINDYLEEFKLFADDLSHKHDDQVDPTLDAIEEMARPYAQINYAAFGRGL